MLSPQASARSCESIRLLMAGFIAHTCWTRLITPTCRSSSRPTSLRAPAARSSGDVNLRVWEHGGTGWVWKFPAHAPIDELVFKGHEGRWRLWEVRYR